LWILSGSLDVIKILKHIVFTQLDLLNAFMQVFWLILNGSQWKCKLAVFPSYHSFSLVFLIQKSTCAFILAIWMPIWILETHCFHTIWMQWMQLCQSVLANVELKLGKRWESSIFKVLPRWSWYWKSAC